MSMTDILYEALERVDGAQFAGVVGTDGLHVDMVASSDELPVDLQTIEAELAALASTAAAAAANVGAGLANEMIVSTDDLTLLAKIVSPGYYAVMGVLVDGNLGRARFAVHQMVNRILAEL
jgi:predicted regulator of Ras-like GTPase activity (Roadblock/LC7/MglB family)